jgi:Zn-finger nucleic acid-binding protein
VADTPYTAPGEPASAQPGAPVERLECPHCRVLMHPRVGAMFEAACSNCLSRFLPPDAAQELASRFLQVEPETVRQLIAHYAGRPLPCPGCTRRMSQVPLRGVNVDICAGCGGMLLRHGDLARLTANTVTEIPPPPEAFVAPAEDPSTVPLATPPLPDEDVHPLRVLGFFPATLGLAALLQGTVNLGALLTRTVLQWRLGPEDAHAVGDVLFGAAAGYLTGPLMVGLAAALTPILRPEIMQSSFWLAGVIGLSLSWTNWTHHGFKGLLVAAGHGVGLVVASRLVATLETAFAQAQAPRAPPRAAWRTVAGALRGWVGRGLLVMGGLAVLSAVGGGVALGLDNMARGACPPGYHEQRATQADLTTAIWCEQRSSGTRHGGYRTVDPMGRVRSQGQYADGRMTGRWTTWHGNGQRHTEGVYVDGERHGTWSTWNDAGALEQQGHFERGMPHGRVVQFHANGHTMAEGTFHRGERNGMWTWYRADGTVERRGMYRRGLEEGPWETHREDGSVERQTFRAGKVLDGAASDNP